MTEPRVCLAKDGRYSFTTWCGYQEARRTKQFVKDVEERIAHLVPHIRSISSRGDSVVTTTPFDCPGCIYKITQESLRLARILVDLPVEAGPTWKAGCIASSCRISRPRGVGTRAQCLCGLEWISEPGIQKLKRDAEAWCAYALALEARLGISGVR